MRLESTVVTVGGRDQVADTQRKNGTSRRCGQAKGGYKCKPHLVYQASSCGRLLPQHTVELNCMRQILRYSRGRRVREAQQIRLM